MESNKYKVTVAFLFPLFSFISSEAFLPCTLEYTPANEGKGEVDLLFLMYQPQLLQTVLCLCALK